MTRRMPTGPKCSQRSVEMSPKFSPAAAAGHGRRAPARRPHPVPRRAAYHDACHLQHAQRVKLQPRAVLATIPGLEVVEIPEAAICCGSAGIYTLVEPQAAQELG